MRLSWIMRPVAGAALMLSGGLTLGLATQIPVQAAAPGCGESSVESGLNTMVTFSADCAWTVPDGVTEIDVLAVGGGGAGGGADLTSPDGAGGGGGGGAVETQTVTVAAGDAVAVTVGAGGQAGGSPNATGGSGGTSSFVDATASVDIEAPGSQGGQGSGGTPTPEGFNPAGSGGSSVKHLGGSFSFDGAGGGAGDSADGSHGVDIPNIAANGGDGGAGTVNDLSGTSVEYGCGGGGGGTMGGSYAFPPYGQLFNTSGVPLITGTLLSAIQSDAAGLGGCANAGHSTQMDGTGTPATAGVAGTGGGGGGGSVTGCGSSGVLVACANYVSLLLGADGGSGTVVISYLTPEVTTTTTVPPTTAPPTTLPTTTPTTTVVTPAPTPTPTTLAFTGAEVGGIALFGVVILFGGAAVIVMSRKRLKRSES